MNDAKQATLQIVYDDGTERKVLCNMTGGLGTVASDPDVMLRQLSFMLDQRFGIDRAKEHRERSQEKLDLYNEGRLQGTLDYIENGHRMNNKPFDREYYAKELRPHYHATKRDGHE